MTTIDTAATAAARIPADDLIDRLWSLMHEIEAADFPALRIVELDEPTDYGERTVLWCPRCDQHVNVEDGYLRAIDVDVRYNSVGQINPAERTLPIYEADPDPRRRSRVPAPDRRARRARCATPRRLAGHLEGLAAPTA